MSTVEVIPAAAEDEVNDNEDAVREDEVPTEEHEAKVQQKEIIRYSLSTLLSLRSSKLSQAKPACRNLDLSCMAHHKPPPKTLIANMMPKFALNQMQNRGEESISPLSFHSNSSSSSNLSYQKRYQDSGRDGRDPRDGPIRRDDGRDGRDDGGYSNSRYYYNKYNKYDNNSASSRIIYKTTGANASNGNNIRLLNKAYNSKYESQESSVGMISNKNILDNSSRVITAADHRNSKKILDHNDAEEKKIKDAEEAAKKSPSDDTNNNENAKKETQESTNVGEVNANELQARNSGQNDLKNLPDDITNHLDDMFNNMNMNQLLPEKSEERGSSRFSKWFNVSKDDTKDEKVPDLQNNNNDGNNVAFPQSVESEKYFQPIDKVESNSLFQMLKGQPERPKEDNPLMQMIQNQQKQQQQKSPNSGQVHSVEELEARLRQHKMNDEQNERKSIESDQRNAQEIMKLHMLQQQQQQQQQQHQPMTQNQEDVNAFRKLLSQIAVEETKIPAQMNPNGPNILQQMMNKSFPQQGAEAMLQQQQKGFPMGGKMPAKMMNPNPVAPHMMPQQQQQQFDMMKFMQQQQQKMPIPQMPEVIKRPEVQAIVQELSAGELSQFNLYQRLTAPGLSPIERDIITSALNIFSATSNANGNSAMFQKSMQPIGGNNLFPMKPNALSAPIPMPQGSPLSPVPPQLDQHLLFQHQAAAAAASKLRLSPLPAAGMPQRIPSPRELQYHTQSIMQNALIRKKLEEQRENFRKRQEQEQKEQMQQKQESDRKNHQDPSLEGCVTSPSQSPEEVPKCILDSPIKKAPAQHQLQRQHAPSPNIFTPTSVLRKMTAEKDGDGKMGSDKKKAITGAQQPRMQQQQQQQQFMGNLAQLDRIIQMQAQSDPFGKVNWDAQPAMKSQGEMRSSEFNFEAQSHMPHPAGRPIVKSAGPGTSQTQQSNPMMTSAQQQPNMMPGNFDFQQQQMQKINLQKQYLQQQQLMQMKKQQQMENPALSQFMAQQQQRAQQQQHMIRQQQFPQQMNYAQQMMQGRPKEPEENNRNMPDNGRNNGGCLSPTSNQLAKWFSPELLADASAGKLPSMKMNGQMLSLEEFEKCIQNS